MSEEEQQLDYGEKILSLLMAGHVSLIEVREGVDPEYYLNPRHRGIYGTILDYFERVDGEIPTVEILRDAIKRDHKGEEEDLWVGMVDRIISAPTSKDDASHLGYYMRSMEQDWQANILKRQMTKAVGDLQKGQVDEAIENLYAEIPNPKGKYIEGNITDDFYPEFEHQEEKRKNPDKYEGIAMGFPSLDEPTGGHHPGELLVMVGGTGVGKSLLLGQIARNVAAKRKRVLHVTVENNKASIMNRHYSSLTGIPYWKFKFGKLDDRDRDLWMQSMSSLPSGYTLQVVEFPEGCSSRDIWFYMRQSRVEYDYVVIDQITNMNPNNIKDFRPMSWQWYGQIALDMKRLSDYAYNNKGIPVLSAAQAAGGTAGKKELTTDDIAMAKVIQHHAHGVLFVTKEDDEYHMGASKYRDARIETFPVYPEFRCWTVTEKPPNMGGHVDPGPGGSMGRDENQSDLGDRID